jgi:hypothetical protein
VVYHRPSIFGLEVLKTGSSSPLTQSVSRRIHLCLYYSLLIELLEAKSSVDLQKPNLTQRCERMVRIQAPLFSKVHLVKEAKSQITQQPLNIKT